MTAMDSEQKVDATDEQAPQGQVDEQRDELHGMLFDDLSTDLTLEQKGGSLNLVGIDTAFVRMSVPGFRSEWHFETQEEAEAFKKALGKALGFSYTNPD